MTLTEKLLARAAEKSSVPAGDNIWVKADVLMIHDVRGSGTIGVSKREFGLVIRGLGHYRRDVMCGRN